ncbi:hypothetical protein B0H11DRAFT_2217498 [Mycena galericulata]|nr:hypothetical protein B0H11DRAFT_2217498 [Mycena galericulata]
MPGSFGGNDLNNAHGPEINMGDGSIYDRPVQPEMDIDTSSIWAREDTSQGPVNHAKRVAVATPARETLTDLRQTVGLAEDKAKTERRQRKEAEAKLQQAQQQIELLQQAQQNTGALLEHQQGLWQEQWNTFQGQLNQDFQQRLEEERARNIEYMNGKVAAQVAAREAELFKQLADAKEQNKREQERLRKEQEKKQADFDTKMAGFHARLSFQQQRAQHSQNNGIEDLFPAAPPVRTPQFVPAATREARRLEMIIREGTDRFPTISMITPTQPEPSAAPGTSKQNSSQASLVDFDDPVIAERLKGLIREEMGVTKSGRKPRRKTKVGLAATLATARRDQQQQLSPIDDLRWKTVGREFWRLKTGFNHAKDFFDYQGVSEATAKGCEAGETAPEASTSKLYFGPGYASSLWNKTILDKCVQEMLEKRKNDPHQYDAPEVSNNYLLALFHNLLTEARNEWSRHQPRAGETFMDARQRADEYEKGRRARNTGNSRKKNKFDGRCKTAREMCRISVAKKDEEAAKTWKWIEEEFIPGLTIGGMSSEEDEPAETQCGNSRRIEIGHKILKCPWRVKKATDYVEMIDEASEKLKPAGRYKRMRDRGEKESMSFPPLGMPKALYDEAWLADQKKWIPDIEEDLAISKKEFQLMEIEVVKSD